VVKPTVTIVPLTEDGSKTAHETWERLVKRLCTAVEPSCDTSRVIPERPSTSLGVAVRGSTLRAQVPSLATIREIATLLQSGRFVLVHFDGDTAWSRRAESTAAAHFRERVASRVRAVVNDSMRAQAPGPKTRRRRSEPSPLPVPEADLTAKVDASLARLRLVCPYYSVEAWLYQATPTAITIARKRYGGRDVELFETWQQDRALADEVERIADEVCLHRFHNADLAAALTREVVDEVLAARTSLHAAVEDLRNCEPLLTALRATVAT
jgi:hypothetical protein